MQINESRFTASDGCPIAMYEFVSESSVAKPKAIVHVIHGMAEHAKRYARVADVLTSEGFLVFAHDHRGHGQTAQSANDLGYFADNDGWNRVVQDAIEIIHHTTAKHPNLPLFVIGHSMGSFILQQIMAEIPNKLTGVVLSASNGPPPPLAKAGRYVARMERLRVGPKGRSPILKALSFDAFNKQFQPNRTPADWLSRDTAEVDKYINDPRCGFNCTTQMWIDMLDAIGDLTAARTLARVRKDLPILVMAGDRDPVSENTKGLKLLLKLYDQAGFSAVTHKFYPHGRHEMFNEVNRKEVIDDVAGWFNRNLPQN